MEEYIGFTLGPSVQEVALFRISTPFMIDSLAFFPKINYVELNYLNILFSIFCLIFAIKDIITVVFFLKRKEN